MHHSSLFLLSWTNMKIPRLTWPKNRLEKTEVQAQGRMHRIINRKKKMLHADLLCGPQWPCTWALSRASALPIKMKHNCPFKRTDKKRKQEVTHTWARESPALTACLTIYSKPLAVWIFPGATWQSKFLSHMNPHTSTSDPDKGASQTLLRKVPVITETHENVPLGNLGVAQSSHKHTTGLFFKLTHSLWHRCGMEGRWNHWVKAVPLPGELGKYFQSKTLLPASIYSTNFWEWSTCKGLY